MTGKISAINNKIVPETVNAAKEIASKAGYTSPSEPIGTLTKKVQEKAVSIDEKTLENFKINHTNLPEPKKVDINELSEAYKAAHGIK